VTGSSQRLVIRVTEHAARQARARAGRDVTDVVRDVRLALHERRSSEARPSFLGPGDAAYRGAVFVWNAARTVAYVARPEPGAPHRWGVVTCLTPTESEAVRPATAIAEAFRRAGLVEGEAA
jgi:hypothetical protein